MNFYFSIITIRFLQLRKIALFSKTKDLSSYGRNTSPTLILRNYNLGGLRVGRYFEHDFL